jgi:hypothetical protein
MTQGYWLRKELSSPEQKELRLARLEQLEDEVLETAAAIVRVGLDFAEVTHDQTEPPPQWVTDYGREEAEKRLRLAKSMWLPASVAPNGMKLAVQTMAGISRTRSYRMKITQNNINVKLALPAPTTAEHPGPVTYEVRDLET